MLLHFSKKHYVNNTVLLRTETSGRADEAVLVVRGEVSTVVTSAGQVSVWEGHKVSRNKAVETSSKAAMPKEALSPRGVSTTSGFMTKAFLGLHQGREGEAC